jgi:hypothetical protein
MSLTLKVAAVFEAGRFYPLNNSSMMKEKFLKF